MDNLSLYYGDNLKISKGLEIRHPKLIDIKKIGCEKYSHYISLLTMRPLDIADVLWYENKVWYEDITQWQLFLQFYKSDLNFRKALFWFTRIRFNKKLYTDGENIAIGNRDKDIYIDEKAFMIISQFIRDINFIPIKTDLQLESAGNKLAKLYIIEQKNKKRKKKQKEKITLESIVSSVDWKGCRGNEIWDYPIYRIYEGYMRLNAIDNYDKTMNAYYSGNIDTSKNKIDLEGINWANKITI